MKIYTVMKKKLERELLSAIIILLVVMFGAFTLFSIKRDTGNLMGQEKQKVDLMAATLTKSIQDMMVTGNADIVGNWVADIKEIHEIKSIQVLRKDGSEAFKDNKTIDNVNKHMGAKAFKQAHTTELKNDDTWPVNKARLEEVLKTGDKVGFFETLNGEEVLTQLTPIANAERCEGCHGYDQHNVRAVLRISAPIKEIRNTIFINMLVIIGVAFFTIIIAFIAVRLLIRKLVIQPLEGILEVVTSMSTGDITNTVDMKTLNPENEIGILASNLNKMSVSMKDLINNISQSSNQMASSSEELSSTAEQMSRGMQQQTTQTSQIASATEEMSATVLEVARNTQSASSSANEASLTAKKGGEVVTRAINGMMSIAATVGQSARTIGDLGKSSDQIGKIVSVINNIADQTNLLALNAAIEAARAGEQGRGFAVVADEVRKLAEKTTKATTEIAAMIENIQNDTVAAVQAMDAGTKEVAEGVNLANQAGESLHVIIGTVDSVNDMIRQIATATEEQSAASEHISMGIEEIARVTRETSEGSDQTAKASHELSRKATELRKLVGQFKV